jgi:hypothetical protein
MTLETIKSWLHNDKFLHFVFGLALFAVLIPFGSAFAFVSVIAVAALKEILDSLGMGTSDPADFVFTLLGATFLLFWYDTLSTVL